MFIVSPERGTLYESGGHLNKVSYSYTDGASSPNDRWSMSKLGQVMAVWVTADNRPVPWD